ncbi:MAG: hypothetical protein A3K19_06090 [Lentisphaerae bacterium RIFOXYB12_FULL_65_16]|nr:MAG: hypothetical protein A3K18_34690 [Lentisphaerae bacterium RIFOXYA12_64_32]OGV94041.1 MAG: hypothetical protein A3K19_06090 [Lentisphaerae bacterium RIFOXYB12_FULL_65_16]
MPFERGTVSFRVCHLPGPMPDDALERFARKAAVPLEQVKDEPLWGWVSGRHLLERRIDEQTAYMGGYLHLCLRQAERKIPNALLRAECRMAELTTEEAQGAPVNRKEKKRIKQEITERLLPQMPPQLSGTPFVVDSNDSRLYVGTTSPKQLDLFLGLFCQTVGFEPVPLTPDTVAKALLDVNPETLPLLNFSPDLADVNAGGSVGQNFLTWLWFFLEDRNGVLPASQLGEFSMLLDGPLVFVSEGGGALDCVIRKGMPTASAEAKTALMVGKKLKRAKLVLARKRGEEWSVTLDADEFVFRSLKLPEGEALDPGSIFEERMTNLYTFQKVFFALFEHYVAEFAQKGKAKAFQERAKKWVKERDAR